MEENLIVARVCYSTIYKITLTFSYFQLLTVCRMSFRLSSIVGIHSYLEPFSKCLLVQISGFVPFLIPFKNRF